MTESNVAVLAAAVSRLVNQVDRLETVVGELREHSAGGPFVQQSVYVVQTQAMIDSLRRFGDHITTLDTLSYDNRNNKLAVADFNAYKAGQVAKFRWAITTAVTALASSGLLAFAHH